MTFFTVRQAPTESVQMRCQMAQAFGSIRSFVRCCPQHGHLIREHTTKGMYVKLAARRRFGQDFLVFYLHITQNWLAGDTYADYKVALSGPYPTGIENFYRRHEWLVNIANMIEYENRFLDMNWEITFVP